MKRLVTRTSQTLMPSRSIHNTSEETTIGGSGWNNADGIKRSSIVLLILTKNQLLSAHKCWIKSKFLSREDKWFRGCRDNIGTNRVNGEKRSRVWSMRSKVKRIICQLQSPDTKLLGELPPNSYVSMLQSMKHEK